MGKLDNLKLGLTYDDISLIPQFSNTVSRSDADVSWSWDKYTFKIPVIAANMNTICEEAMAFEMYKSGGLGIIHRYMKISDQLKITETLRNHGQDPICHSVGSIYSDKERIEFLIKNNAADILCVDIAHGDSIHMSDTLKFIRDMKPDALIIAGNVATPEGCGALFEWGANLVKIGISNGGPCSTKWKTGVCVPQFTAVYECAKVGPIIADGGIRSPGDVCKALSAGAKAVMVGTMLAGTDCVPKWAGPGMPISYAGMASNQAKIAGGLKPGNEEGVVKTIVSKKGGSTGDVLNSIVEGLKSAMSYSGASNLEEFERKVVYIKTSNNGVYNNRNDLDNQ